MFISQLFWAKAANNYFMDTILFKHASIERGAMHICLSTFDILVKFNLIAAQYCTLYRPFEYMYCTVSCQRPLFYECNLLDAQMVRIDLIKQTGDFREFSHCINKVTYSIKLTHPYTHATNRIAYL